MTGSSSILPFASGSNANVVTDSHWQSLVNSGSLQTGFVQGLAQSAQVNKALRQTSALSAGLAQFLANNGNTVDDSLTPAQIATMIQDSVQDAVSTSNVSGYIQAWSSTVANNGTGYPQYAVVADPTYTGVLYMSTISNNTTKPSFTDPVSEWLVLPENKIVSVTSFGIVNDTSKENVNANSNAFANMVDFINNTQGLFAIYLPSGMTITLNQNYTFTTDVRIIIDGTINFSGSGDFLTFTNTVNTSDTNNTSIVTGCGVINGNNTGIVFNTQGVSIIIENIFINNGNPYAVSLNSPQSFLTNVGMLGSTTADLFINSNQILVNGGNYNAIQLGNCSLVTISNVQFYKSPITAISVASGSSVSDILINGCYFYQTEKTAINLVGSSSQLLYNITIQNCNFFQTGTQNASCDISGSYIQHFRVLRNISNGNSNIATNLSGNSGLAAFGFNESITNLVIMDNILVNTGQLNGRYGYGFYLSNPTDCIIRNNIITNYNNTLISPMIGTVSNTTVIENNYYNNSQFNSVTPNTNNALGCGLTFPNIGVGLRQSGSNIVQRSGVFTCTYNGTNYKERYSALFIRTDTGWLTYQTLWFPGNTSTCNSPFGSSFGNFSVYWCRLWRFPFTSIIIDQSSVTELSTSYITNSAGYAQSVFALNSSNPPSLEYGWLGLRNDDAGASDPYEAPYYSAFLKCVGITNGADYDYSSAKGWANFNDQVDNQQTITPSINGGA